MSTLQPIVINGHGSKTNHSFDIKNHTLLTPEDLSIPYFFAYDKDHNASVNDVEIDPWTKADKIRKVKVFSETSLSEILNQIEEISGPKRAMLATCNAGFNNKIVTYDTFSPKQDVAEIAKGQGFDLDQASTVAKECVVDVQMGDVALVDRALNIKFDAKNAFEKQGFHYGPLQKSLHTQELELLTKCLLKNPNDFNLKVAYDICGGKQVLMATNKNLDFDINVSDLLDKANFTHLYFNTEDCNLYSSQFVDFQYDQYRDAHAPELSKAEKSALVCYTGCGYYDVNNLMHGDFDKVSGSLKVTLLKSLFIGSGLNKIMPDTEICSKTYRGDKPDDAQVEERIDLVKQGGGTTDTSAFFSTSLSEWTANAFAHKCLIHFEERYGKNISWLSDFPCEKEYLLEPAKILWTGYENVNGKHVFHAQKVVPLEETPAVTEQDKTIFSKLVDWANDHGVATDFLTPDLQSSLGSKVKSAAISIHDCITMDSGFSNIISLSSNATAPVNNSSTVDTVVTQLLHLDLSPIMTMQVDF